MLKRFFILISVVIPLFIVSCGTGRISSLKRESNEAIIIAKIDVFNYDNPQARNSRIFFDEMALGTYSVKPDDNYYIYMKIPVGLHYLARIEIDSKSLNIPETFTSFETSKGGLYYIGDITTCVELDFNAGMMFGLMGGLAYEIRQVDPPQIYVDNNYNDAVKYFKSKFPTDEPIILNLMQADTTNHRDRPKPKSFSTEKIKLNPLREKRRQGEKK